MDSLRELPGRRRGPVRAPHRAQTGGRVHDRVLSALSAPAHDATVNPYGVDNTLQRSRTMPLVRRT